MNDDNYYQKRAVRRLVIAAVVIVIVGVGAWYFYRSDSFQKIAAFEHSAERIAAENFSANFSAPEPLVATTTAAAKPGAPKQNKYTLTRAGVIADTNAARAANAATSTTTLAPLAENATLDDIAQIRLDDMFAKQYFAHISPSSSSALTVAQAVGYDYIALGENLALGDFAGDQAVVTAWMASPGHRANILDPHYDEIGVAVGKGNFQGENAWIAVQVFGRPKSDCPEPSAALKTQIDAEQTQISQMQSELQTDQSNGNYSDYNAMVATYNKFVAQLKSDIAQYNAAVDEYNACL